MTVTVKTFETASEAAHAIAAETSAHFLAGGTLIMRAVNEGDPAVRSIVMVRDAAMKEIRPAGTGIEIGAAATMTDILGSHDLGFLHAAARAVGGPAIRNMATLGGNLFARSPYGDLATALLALDGVVIIASSGGTREMALSEFLAGRDGPTSGVVMSVRISRPASLDAFRFHKVSRVRPKRTAVLTIAAHLPMSGGRVSGARVAYGAMAPTPIRVPAVEQALEGASLDEQGIARALAVANDGCAPANDAIASEWYRREVMPVHLKRLLLGQAA
jgi:CO/xanthine dehydrogenase FAD-binding subunit